METDSSLASGRSAPYGRTCTNCVKAKCKCIIRMGGDGCTRCHRLNKECRPSETVRKRNAKAGTNGTLQTAPQLEEKLDGLVSLLTAITQAGVNAIDPQPAANKPSTGGNSVTNEDYPTPQSDPVETPSSGISKDHLSNPPPVSSETSCTTSSEPPAKYGCWGSSVTPASLGFGIVSSDSSLSNLYSAFEPSLLEAEGNFETFRTIMLPRFPLVYIPPSTSARQFCQENPFLFLVIMTIASRSTTYKLALGKEIKQLLAQYVCLESKASLDQLLGLLALLAWGHDQFFNTPLQSRFTALAMSMVFDLRLNKPLPKETNILPTLTAQGHKRPEHPVGRSLTERRAVLACYLQSSNVALYYATIDSLRWTPHMDDCLQTLVDRQEWPGDEMLVYQVRLQLIVEKVIQAKWDDEHLESIRMPPAFYLKALKSELFEFMRRVSPGLRNNDILLAHKYNAELTINEIAFSKTPITTNALGFEQLEFRFACLNSIKSWCDLFFAIPPSEYIGISYLSHAQAGHSIVALYRLTQFEDPSWDKALVRNTADILLILDQIIDNFGQASISWGDNSEQDIYNRFRGMFTAIRSWCGTRLNGDTIQSYIPAEQAVDDPMQETLPMDFLDDAWFTNVLGSWNY